MFKRLALAAAFGTAMGALGAPVNAGTLYDESVSGDFSNSGFSPTVVSFALGSNQIVGTTGKSGVVVDRDYFTFTVPTGEVLASLTVLAGTTTLSGTLGSFSFIGLEAGNEVTVLPNVSTAAGLLGWDHYSAADIGTDILPAMGSSGLSATDFVPPLGAGDYAVWVQDTGAGVANYGFDFVVANVPEPASWTMLVFGLIGLARLRWPRRLQTSRSTLAART